MTDASAHVVDRRPQRIVDRVLTDEIDRDLLGEASDDSGAGEVACRVAAHSVGDREDRRSCEQAVLVDRTTVSLVAQCGPGEADTGPCSSGHGHIVASVAATDLGHAHPLVVVPDE